MPNNIDEVTGSDIIALPYRRIKAILQPYNPMVALGNMLTIVANTAHRLRPMGILNITDKAGIGESTVHTIGEDRELAVRIVRLIGQCPAFEFVRRQVSHDYFASASRDEGGFQALTPPLSATQKEHLKTAKALRQALKQARTADVGNRSPAAHVKYVLANLAALTKEALYPDTSTAGAGGSSGQGKAAVELFKVREAVGQFQHQASTLIVAQESLSGPTQANEALSWLDEMGMPTHDACVVFGSLLFMLDFPSMEAAPLFVLRDDPDLEGNALNTPEGRQREEDATINRMYLLLHHYYAQLPMLVRGVRSRTTDLYLAAASSGADKQAAEWITKIALNSDSIFGMHPLVQAVVDNLKTSRVRVISGDGPAFFMPNNAFRFALAYGATWPSDTPDMATTNAAQLQEQVAKVYDAKAAASAGFARLAEVVRPPSFAGRQRVKLRNQDPWVQLLDRAGRFTTPEFASFLSVDSAAANASALAWRNAHNTTGVHDGESAVSYVRHLKHMARVSQHIESQYAHSLGQARSVTNWGNRSLLKLRAGIEVPLAWQPFAWTDGVSASGDARISIFGFQTLVPITLHNFRAPRRTEQQIARQQFTVFTVQEEDDDLISTAPRGYRSYFIPEWAWMGEPCTRLTADIVLADARKMFHFMNTEENKLKLLRKMISPSTSGGAPIVPTGDDADKVYTFEPSQLKIGWRPVEQEGKITYNHVSRMYMTGRREIVNGMPDFSLVANGPDAALKSSLIATIVDAEFSEATLRQLTTTTKVSFTDARETEIIASAAFGSDDDADVTVFWRRITLDETPGCNNVVLPYEEQDVGVPATCTLEYYGRYATPEVPAVTLTMAGIAQEVLAMTHGKLAERVQ